MSKAYIEWIDQEINRHQTEIARLTVARGVIEDVSKTFIGRGKVILTGKYATVKPSKKKRSHSNTRDIIIEAMRKLDRPVTPKEITVEVRAEHPELGEKMLWNALYNARIVGKVVRNGKMYSLPVEKAPVLEKTG